MLVRVNVPHWGFAEVRDGLAAVVGLAGDAPDALAKRIRQDVGDRRFQLVASGRAGLLRAAQVLGMTGRRVAVPGYVCPAVLAAMRAAGADVAVMDCAPESFGFDANALLAAARIGDIDAVVAPSTYGAPQDSEMLGRCGLPWIEDAAYQGGEPVTAGLAGVPGLAGHAGVWSFNFKTLAGVGGGVVFLPGVATADHEVIGGLALHAPPRERSRPRAHERATFSNYVLRTMGRHHIPRWFPGASAPIPLHEQYRRNALDHVPLGSMSQLQAAVAVAQWDRRAELLRRTRQNAGRIGQVIADSPVLAEVVPAVDRPGEPPRFPHLYPVLLARGIPDPDRWLWALRSWMHDAGVQTEDPYPLPDGSGGVCRNAMALRQRLLLVPCHASLSDGVMERVARVLLGAAQRLGASL